MALGMVDGLSVSGRRFWRSARQRRGRCAIAQPGAAKSVVLPASRPDGGACFVEVVGLSAVKTRAAYLLRAMRNKVITVDLIVILGNTVEKNGRPNARLQACLVAPMRRA